MKFLNQKTFYLLSSFLAGFSIMTVQLISTRIVAPIIGSSVFTWTSVIGITLLGLSIGSWLGGKIADKMESSGNKALSLTFLLSAFLVSVIPLLATKTSFLINYSSSILGLNVFLALYLFLFPTLSIGMIQPMILKRVADDFSKIGSKYGVLSAVWSAGGILGVFLTGFYFISNIGSSETIWLVSVILFLIGIIFSLKNKKTLWLFLVTIIFVSILIYNTKQKNINDNIIFQKETNYYNAKVLNAFLPEFGESKILLLDFDVHSIESTETNQYFYPEMYPVFSHLKEEIKNILVIGAGAYTMPKNFKNYYPDAEVVVVEMDGELVNIGNNYFDLGKYDIETIVGDIRIVINKDTKKYDVIFGDAYNSFISVPWYLLTKEWNDEVYNKLNDGGIYAINFIGSLLGEKSEFTKSVTNTFKQSFPNFYIFTFGATPNGVQNIVLVGIKGQLPVDEKTLANKLKSSKNNFLAERLTYSKIFEYEKSAILTNNFAPVEKLMQPIIKDYFLKNLQQIKTLLRDEQPT